MREIRVLHVLYSLDPGGLENGVVNLANGLRDRGFKTRVVCIDRAGDFAERLLAPTEVEVIGRTGGFSQKAVVSLAGAILRFRPHVLHTHNLGPLIYGVLGSGLGMLSPILQGEHAALTPEELQPRRIRLRRWLYRSCRLVHTVSHGLTRQLGGTGLGRREIRTLVNGVDTDRFSPAEKSESRRLLGLPTEGMVVGMVGRFGPFKRHEFAIETFERIAGERGDVRLLLVGGGGPLEDVVRRRVAASGVADRIIVTGHQRDPAPWYRAMDLLLIPSENEGLSNAMLEAMASAVAVVSNDTCGARDVIEPEVDGFILSMEAPAPTAGKLLALLEGDRTAEAGRKAREKTLNEYSIEKMISRYASIYREIANPRSGD